MCNKTRTGVYEKEQSGNPGNEKHSTFIKSSIDRINSILDTTIETTGELEDDIEEFTQNAT